MPRYQDSGRPRGYAHLDFKKAESLEKAIGLNGMCLFFQSAPSRTYHPWGSITAGSPFCVRSHAVRILRMTTCRTISYGEVS